MKSAQRQHSTHSSDMSDVNIPTSRIKQAKSRNDELSFRMREAMDGRTLGWLSRETGIPVSTLSEYSGKGKVPPADKGLLIAHALGVSLEHLVFGEAKTKSATILDASQSDWLFLPLYDLFKFSAEGKPEPKETVPLRRDQVYQAVRTTTGLWLTEMPNDFLPDVARSGDILICQDVSDEPLGEGRVYVFRQDGAPFLRRVQLGLDGLVLTAIAGVEPIRVSSIDLHTLIPIGRVLGSLSLRSV